MDENEMPDRFARTALLLGEDAMARLRRSRVAVFGLGGVGGYVVEALARSGIGTLVLFDHDTVSLTNLNRQILATCETVGQYKVDAAADRVHAISPDTVVIGHRCFFLPETADAFDFSEFDYAVDAIDTLSGKVEIVMRARAAGVPVISAMGAGNKLNPGAFRVADLAETRVCPLARAMRQALRRRGVEHLKVVYSEETPRSPDPAAAQRYLADTGTAEKARIPGSVSFVPPVMGLLIAGEVIRDLAAGGETALPENRKS